jgi:hypothetical protein
MGQYVGDGITFHTRQDLGLGPNTAPALDRSRVTHGFVHYTTGEELGRDDFAQWWRDIDRHHKVVNGWENGLAYCWGVARDTDPERAHVLEGRGLAVGGHTRDWNSRSVGIVFLGDDDPDYADATPGVRRALAWLIAHAEAGLATSLTWQGHRDVVATGCPGDELHAWVHGGRPITPYIGSPGVRPLPAPPLPVPDIPEPTLGLPRPKPTLRRGSYGQQVADLQHALNVFDQKLGVDGIFGRRTRHAVMNFQRFWKIGVDGIYGPISARTLDAALTMAGR